MKVRVGWRERRPPTAGRSRGCGSWTHWEGDGLGCGGLRDWEEKESRAAGGARQVDKERFGSLGRRTLRFGAVVARRGFCVLEQRCRNNGEYRKGKPKSI